MYEEFWNMIVVSGPNGTNFVGLSPTLQVFLANVTKVKVKNMATIVHRTRKKKKDELMKRVITRQNPHKIKIKLGGDINGGCDGKNAWTRR